MLDTGFLQLNHQIALYCSAVLNLRCLVSIIAFLYAVIYLLLLSMFRMFSFVVNKCYDRFSSYLIYNSNKAKGMVS